jgi:hypothetical protein
MSPKEVTQDRAHPMTFRLPRTSRALGKLQPADLWLAARMLAWSPILPFIKYVMPLPQLIRLMTRGKGRSTWQPPPERKIIRLAHAIYRLEVVTKHGRCLERSLLAYRYLTLCGAKPELVVGVRKDGQRLQGHAWINLGGAPFGESPSEVSDFRPILIFDDHGRQKTVAKPRGQAAH